MPNLVYRVVSACGTLGYGFPRESLQAALRGGVNAIICDAGSIDAGPYYLGAGTDYFERDAVKADYRHMVEAGLKIGCPVILGSSGMGGGNRNLDRVVEIAKEIFSELAVREATVAVIRSELDPEIAIREYRAGALRPTGGEWDHHRPRLPLLKDIAHGRLPDTRLRRHRHRGRRCRHARRH